MALSRLFMAGFACAIAIAPPIFADETRQFFPLRATSSASAPVIAGNKFFVLRPGSPGNTAGNTTLHPRVLRPTAPAATVASSVNVPPAPAVAEAKVIKPEEDLPEFSLKRYQPTQRKTYTLNAYAPASLRLPSRLSKAAEASAPMPANNNGNRELVSNAPYSSSFYGTSNIGITEHHWPVDLSAQQRVSSGFGFRSHPVTGRHAFHKGVDIAAPTGSAVLASADGVVEETGQDQLIGKYVRLRHPDGSQSLYGHLSSVSVKKADWLQRHQKLGAVGSTGRTTGPHLHFALQLDGKPMNPMEYLTQPNRQQLALR